MRHFTQIDTVAVRFRASVSVWVDQPLLFQRGACGITDAIVRTDWRNYQLSQPKASLPVGPMALLVHIASVWVPFTSESKEAIADYDEIRKEMKLALMECGRKLGTYLRKRQKMQREAARRDVFERYIGEISKAVNAIKVCIRGEDLDFTKLSIGAAPFGDLSALKLKHSPKQAAGFTL